MAPEGDDRASGDKPRGRRALGRGLGALLTTPGETALREVDVDRIERNASQPRQQFSTDALAELAASIREHGLVQPLVVSAIGDDRYRLIVGERRWRAAQLAGLARVPVMIKDLTDQQTLEVALVENVQRADLNPLEEAEAYQRLVGDFGLTQQQVADRVGKSRTAVANTLRLLALPDALKQAVSAGRITEGHARALLGITDKQLQTRALQKVEDDGLTVRQTEALVRELARAREGVRPREEDPNTVSLAHSLERALGTRVTLRPGKRGGRIIIEYYSDEEFQSLYDQLTGTFPAG